MLSPWRPFLSRRNLKKLLSTNHLRHRGPPVTPYFERHHPDWFKFEELPGYAPELNPVEQCWKHTKYDDLPNFVPDNIDQLYAEATRSLDSLRGDEDFLRTAFAYCELPI